MTWKVCTGHRGADLVKTGAFVLQMLLFLLYIMIEPSHLDRRDQLLQGRDRD